MDVRRDSPESEFEARQDLKPELSREVLRDPVTYRAVSRVGTTKRVPNLEHATPIGLTWNFGTKLRVTPYHRGPTPGFVALHQDRVIGSVSLSATVPAMGFDGIDLTQSRSMVFGRRVRLGEVAASVWFLGKDVFFCE